MNGVPVSFSGYLSAKGSASIQEVIHSKDSFPHQPCYKKPRRQHMMAGLFNDGSLVATPAAIVAGFRPRRLLLGIVAQPGKMHG
jgi:hypothetical protein